MFNVSYTSSYLITSTISLSMPRHTFKVTYMSSYFTTITISLSTLLEPPAASRSVLALLSSLSRNQSCLAELRLWFHLLSSWNGISFFYDDQLLTPLTSSYTDAAPSADFGGFYNGRWLWSEWPPELMDNCQVASSAFEIYPRSSHRCSMGTRIV